MARIGIESDFDSLYARLLTASYCYLICSQHAQVQ